MNEKNRKMLEILSSILMVDTDKLVDRMINLPQKEFDELEERLLMMEQEVVSKQK